MWDRRKRPNFYRSSQIEKRAIAHKESTTMFTVSQAAMQQVLNDIRTGNDADYVASFFAARPEWFNTDEQASTQTDNKQQEEKQEAVKA
jgi:hypothetical protein